MYYKVIYGDEAAKFIRDSNYQTFLKQIVVEYTEMRVNKKPRLQSKLLHLRIKTHRIS